MVFCKIRRENLLGRLVLAALVLLRFFWRRKVEHFPADLLHETAGGVVPVDDVAISNRADDGGHRPDVIVMPGAEQAPANQIVDGALVLGHGGLLGRHGCRDDRVVIGHFRVVDEPSPERTHSCTGRELRAIRRFDRLDDARKRLCHILRQVTAVRSRIADEFVFFVQRLGDIQSFLRAETEQAIRVPLQFRQVVQKRRGRPLRCGIDGFDRRLSRKCPLDDRLCLDPVNRQTRFLRL